MDPPTPPPKQDYIDSHIHLWPQDAANEDGHAWMTPGMPLAKQHLLPNYYSATRQDNHYQSDYNLKGVIYIETDRRYDPPNGDDIATWATGPLKEIDFVRDIVEGRYGYRDAEMLKGIVLWAPMDQPTEVLVHYLQLAQKRAGAKTWRRVRGFRFLLQAITDQVKFNELVWGENFIRNLQYLGKKEYAFDVGVDQNSAGAWQLETMVEVMEKAFWKIWPNNEESVAIPSGCRFILNHMMKPNFSDSQGDAFERWKAAIDRVSQSFVIYMKLSGCFSELPPGLDTVEAVVDFLEPWVNHLFTRFGSKRIMFGSDWPVCNLKGLGGELGTWVSWAEIVKQLTHKINMTPADKENIWHNTALEAYKLTPGLIEHTGQEPSR